MENNIVIISGASATGKSTAAKIISKETNILLFSIREHYKSTILPMYYREKDFTFTRKNTMKVADWMYKKDTAFHAKLLEKQGVFNQDVIIEGLRIKEDIQYICEKYKNTKIIHFFANLETRISRKKKENDAFQDHSCIEQELIYEWDHFKLQKTQAYLSQKALMIDSSNYNTFLNSTKKKILDYLKR